MKLWPCDFDIQTGMMSVKIVWSKTDQLHQGDSVVIAWTGTSTYPVAKLECCLTKSAMPLDDETPLLSCLMYQEW